MTVNPAKANNSLPYFSDWPKIKSAVPKDPKIESEVIRLLSLMTLEEKVGQMIQPDLREVTPQEAAEFKLGSILNGGGSWPNNEKYSSATDWAETAEAFYQALEDAYEHRGFRVPFAWATDAVHGHNNVFKATLFPHNIGLGAANDPDLIEAIGKATALEVAATGLDWTFAPTVAVPRNNRWGRVYEGYSEDPNITYIYAPRMVRGLQGPLENGLQPGRVISTVKHWVGDGGTTDGVDRGENHYSERDLINIHAPGYFSALNAGAQVVMTSFNSWHDAKNYDLFGNDNYNSKLHGSKYIITDVLKNKMGFDGVVVTDWNGHSEINGCNSEDCPQAVLAGNDVLMVTSRKDWKQFYYNVIRQVHEGIIPLDRIDDAVSRILRVKMRAGLWEKPSPINREFAGNNSLLGNDEHRLLAREAVRKSLVLLKNCDQILPLKKSSNFLVLGSGANDIQKQTGGWSLSWQGNENEIDADFPGAKTFLSAVRETVGDANVFTDLTSAPDDSIALVVIGEDPYAEMMGDIKLSKSLEYSKIKRSYKADLEILKELKAKGFRVITILYSGRTLYVNEEISLSDAFVAAWLPGTEALGITDVLFSQGEYDFSGRLSYSWPNTKQGSAVNFPAKHIPNFKTPNSEQDPSGEHAPLLPLGYGLSYDDSKSNSFGIDLTSIKLNKSTDDVENSSYILKAKDNLELFGASADSDFVIKLSGLANNWLGVQASKGVETSISTLTSRPVDYKHQQDALRLVFNGESPSQTYVTLLDDDTFDGRPFLNAEGFLQFDIRLESPLPNSLSLAMHCQWPCKGEVKLIDYLSEEQRNSPEWQTIRVPLVDFYNQGMDFESISSPFLLYSDQPCTLVLGKVSFVPGGFI